MTKDEAQHETIRRWRELPIMSRQTQEQALGFAQVLAAALEFETLGNKQRIIESWLVRDIDNRDNAVRAVLTTPVPVARRR